MYTATKRDALEKNEVGARRSAATGEEGARCDRGRMGSTVAIVGKWVTAALEKVVGLDPMRTRDGSRSPREPRRPRQGPGCEMCARRGAAPSGSRGSLRSPTVSFVFSGPQRGCYRSLLLGGGGVEVDPDGLGCTCRPVFFYVNCSMLELQAALYK